jgi:hypothetical protein
VSIYSIYNSTQVLEHDGSMAHRPTEGQDRSKDEKKTAVKVGYKVAQDRNEGLRAKFARSKFIAKDSVCKCRQL